MVGTEEKGLGRAAVENKTVAVGGAVLLALNGLKAG